MAELIWFRCFIEGQHFPGVLLNEKGTVGFYTTRFVQAEGPEQAELEAVALLKREGELELPPGTPKPTSARVFVTEIEEIQASQVPEVQAGFSFFVE